MATDTRFAGSLLTRPKRKARMIPWYAPYLFLVPAILLLILFRYIPAVAAVYYSFTDWDGTSPANFIGLQQYQNLFADEVFVQSLRNIIFYTLNRALIGTVMALIGAELVYNLRNGLSQSIWRIVF